MQVQGVRRREGGRALRGIGSLRKDLKFKLSKRNEMLYWASFIVVVVVVVAVALSICPMAV